MSDDREDLLNGALDRICVCELDHMSGGQASCQLTATTETLTNWS